MNRSFRSLAPSIVLGCGVMLFLVGSAAAFGAHTTANYRMIFLRFVPFSDDDGSNAANVTIM